MAAVASHTAMSIPSISLDSYVVDSLLPDLVGHDRQPSAFLVYLVLWRLTHDAGTPTARVALRDIAEATGFPRAERAELARHTQADRSGACEHHRDPGLYRDAPVETLLSRRTTNGAMIAPPLP